MARALALPEPRLPAGHASRLAFADGIRGIAALWVVLFHASEGGHVDHLKAVLPVWFNRLVFDWGHLGVALFFVLSGFVMMHTVRGYAFTAGFGGRFLLRRLLRLTPPYHASIVFVLGYAALKAALQHQPAPLPSSGVVLAHAFYLQDLLSLESLSVVYWTLGIEIQFYIAFAALMLAQHHAARRWGARVAAPVLLGAAAVVGLPWTFDLVSTPLYPGGFMSFWYCFMLGVLVSAQDHDARLAKPFVAYVAIVAAAALVTGSGFAWAALAAVLLIYGGGRSARVARILNLRALQYLGLISYSLYLTHNQITGATKFALARLLSSTAASELALLVAIIVACLVFATLGHRWVERPSIAWSRRVSFKQRPAAA